MQQEQAMVYSTNAWFRRGFWYSQADVVAMLRTENQVVLHFGRQHRRRERVSTT